MRGCDHCSRACRRCASVSLCLRDSGCLPVCNHTAIVSRLVCLSLRACVRWCVRVGVLWGSAVRRSDGDVLGTPVGGGGGRKFVVVVVLIVVVCSYTSSGTEGSRLSPAMIQTERDMVVWLQAPATPQHPTLARVVGDEGRTNERTKAGRKEQMKEPMDSEGGGGQTRIPNTKQAQRL